MMPVRPSLLSASSAMLLSLVNIPALSAAAAAATQSTPDENQHEDDGKSHDHHHHHHHLYSPSTPSFLFVLIDDVGYADLTLPHTASGIARTPNIQAWTQSRGTLTLPDFHSAGTVCSPTRATVLTGRNHFRDCVDYVYGCSDMADCVPNFEFAPMKTFTVGDAVRSSSKGTDFEDGAYFAGKWHLGSFFNDSEALGGKFSSPMCHGFDHMNATVEVAPTASANCQCRPEWESHCDFGHYHRMTHCYPNTDKCCFNYWWDDPLSPHGVTNLTWPSPEDDAAYLVDAFSRFLADRRERTSSSSASGASSPTTGNSVRGSGSGQQEEGGTTTTTGPPAPFFAQLSFHNCHIPFVGMSSTKASCARGEKCRPPADGEPPYTDEELDYYACLIQLDEAVGEVIDALKREGYYDNTMIWFTSDNGPENNCPPEGICKRAADLPHRPEEGPGSAGPLRGRKRDIYEGGHRVPGIVSWPAVIGADANVGGDGDNGGDDDDGSSEGASTGGAVSWETVLTVDFLPTVMDVLGVDRPPSQQHWAMDGRSILPILRGQKWADTPGGPRSFGMGYYDARTTVVNGWGYRHGRWKFVEGSASCTVPECRRPQLFDLDADLGERRDLADERPDVLAAMQRNFSLWHESVMISRREESKCSKPAELLLPMSMRGHLRPREKGIEVNID